jgi:hypothetical protein
MLEWLVNHAWIIDDVTLLVMIVLGLRCLLRKRLPSVSGNDQSGAPQSDLPEARLVAARLGIPEDWLDARAAQQAVQDASGLVRKQVVGRDGRFFQCAEHVLEGNARTRVIEVDSLGQPCGEEVELARDFTEVTRQLI